MANYCIPKENIAKLKEAVKSIADNGQISALAEMKTDDRVRFFKKVLSENDAVQLNKRFERSVGQKRLNALKTWVRDNLDEVYRKDEVIFNMKRYQNLEEVDNFINSRMELLAEQKLGIALTDEQVSAMTTLGKKYYDESLELGNNLGKVGFEEENIKWGKAFKELSEYRDSLMPVSWWKALVNSLGRANMLASIKTPFLNIESNTINAITEAIVRRFETQTLFAPATKDLSKAYRKFSLKMFKETGVDFTRMIDLDDTVTGMGKIVGEETSRLPFKFGRSYVDFIFNKTLSVPDVGFASVAFTDSLSLNATKMAKGNDELANLLFKEATNVGATGDAKVLRDIAISDARFATYTNDSFSAKMSEGLRKVLNKVGGLGDVLMPFVTTPGNVAELAADYAGFGFVKGGFGVGKSLMKEGKISRSTMRDAMRNVARSGVGMTAGYLMASQFDVEHFIGVYDPQRVKVNQLANTAYNAVLIKTPIGDKWVSVDYLGPLAAPFVSFMYAKKYGKPGYISGATSAYLSQLPFVDAKSLFDGLDTLTDPENTGKTVKLGKDLGGSLADTIYSRLVPGIMYDIARAADDVQRNTRQKKYVVSVPIFGELSYDRFVNKVPFLRTELPMKHDVLGRVMLETSPIESMLFGSRVRTANTDAITSEILRLREEGNTPNVKDLRFMNSSQVDRLRNKVGEDKFVDLTIKYGTDVAKKYKKEMRSASYKRLSDEEKSQRLSDISKQEYNNLMKRNGVK